MLAITCLAVAASRLVLCNARCSSQGTFDGSGACVPSAALTYERNDTWDSPGGDYGGYSAWTDGINVYTVATSDASGSNDLVLIKWDMNGDFVWNRTFGTAESEEGWGIWGDGTYIYTTGTAYNGMDMDVLLVKWTKDGDQVWNVTTGGAYSDAGKAIWGNASVVYVVGYIEVGGVANDIALIKWNATNHEVMNTWTWGGSQNDQGNHITSDGNAIYTCGITDSFGAGNIDHVLIKWSLSGSQLWNCTYGGVYGDGANNVQVIGNAVYTCGWQTTINTTLGLLVKWNADNGNQLWNKTFDTGVSTVFRSMWYDGDSIYTCGSTQINPAADYAAFVVAWSLNGTATWNGTATFPTTGEGNAITGSGSSIFICCDFAATNGTYAIALIKWIIPGGGIAGFSDAAIVVAILIPTALLAGRRRSRR